jgi:hypothetical protein
VTVRKADNGKLIVRLPDGDMLFSEAVRTGRISVKR